MADGGRCSLGGARSGRKDSPPVCDGIQAAMAYTLSLKQFRLQRSTFLYLKLTLKSPRDTPDCSARTRLRGWGP